LPGDGEVFVERVERSQPGLDDCSREAFLDELAQGRVGNRFAVDLRQGLLGRDDE